MPAGNPAVVEADARDAKELGGLIGGGLVPQNHLGYPQDVAEVVAALAAVPSNFRSGP